MSESDSGKKVGVFGALIAGIGMVLARGADDCARIGARGASLADDGARFGARGASLADDGARFGARGAGLSDDALRGGRAAGLSDDTLRGAGNAPHLPPGAADDALGAGSRAGQPGDIFESGLDVSLEVVSFDFGGDDDSGPAAPPIPARPSALNPAVEGTGAIGGARALARRFVEAPKAIGLLPASAAGYKRVFGKAPKSDALTALTVVTGFLEQPATDIGMKGLAELIAERRASNPVTIIGYTSGVDSEIALPSGERASDAEIHEACMNVGINCVVIACDPAAPSPSTDKPCAHAAYLAWFFAASASSRAGREKPLASFARELAERRDADAHSDAMIISRVHRAPDGTLKLIRSRPRAAGSP